MSFRALVLGDKGVLRHRSGERVMSVIWLQPQFLTRDVMFLDFLNRVFYLESDLSFSLQR